MAKASQKGGSHPVLAEDRRWIFGAFRRKKGKIPFERRMDKQAPDLPCALRILPKVKVQEPLSPMGHISQDPPGTSEAADSNKSYIQVYEAT